MSHDQEPAVTWAQVDEGFHVGSRAGDFLGYVDRQPDGIYTAYDMASRVLGGFNDLSQAIQAVNSCSLKADA